MSPRYVVYGAGAIGGVVGGLLAAAGNEVALIARGRHLERIADAGLRVRLPDSDRTVRAPAAASLGQLGPRADDVVLLCTKTQDTIGVLDEMAAAGFSGPVVCLQNGVENERLALRRFEHVHGGCVIMPATHLEPGVVVGHCAPVVGLIEIGRYPQGADRVDGDLAEALGAAGLSGSVRPHVMDWKYAKLLANLANIVEAACGPMEAPRVVAAARAEAIACYRAAGIAWVDDEEVARLRARLSPMGEVVGAPRAGGSTWQSLRRGGSLETDYLNGEVVLLGRRHGVATPFNAALQRLGRELAGSEARPGGMTVGELERWLDL